MVRRVRAVAASGTLLVPLGLATGACNLFVNFEPGQCSSDADCVALAADDPSFAGLSCVDSVCAQPGTGPTGGCTSSEQCTKDNSGQPHVCRSPGQPCTKLFSDDCLDVVGPFEDPNVVLLGFLDKMRGNDFNVLVGDTHQCGMQLAAKHFEAYAQGLPQFGGGPRRPVAYVVCDSDTDPVRAATHLVDAVGVQAIVGPNWSEDVVKLVPNVTAPAGVLVLSGAAGSPSLLGMADEGLFWSCIMNDDLGAFSLGALLGLTEKELRKDPDLKKIRVALVDWYDAVSRAIADKLVTTLQFNGTSATDNLKDTSAECGPSSCFRRFDVPDPPEGSNTPDYGPTITKLADFNAHVVMLVTSNGSFVNDAMPLVETTDQASPAPMWLYYFDDPSLLGYALGSKAPADLYQRVLALRIVKGGSLYDDFVANYAGHCPEVLDAVQKLAPGSFPPFVEYTYDATLMMSFAHLAAGNHKQPTELLTGKLLAGGLLKLSPYGADPSPAPIPYELRTNTLADIVSTLASGAQVDPQGVSGNLDFDPEYHSPIQKMEVICISPGTRFPNTAGWAPTGAVWDPKTQRLTGGHECPASPP
jgi:hypothetical protein